MDFNTFEQQFVSYCEIPGIRSGKARSYYLAIRYLAEYLNLPDLGHGRAYKITDHEEDIKDRGSNFYRQLEQWLERHGRKSYLTNGYISAAMKLFGPFAADHNLF